MKEKVPTGVTAGVLRLLKYGNVAQLEALAKLAEEEEEFDDAVLLLEARRRTQKILEKAYAAGKLTEEKVLDGVLALGDAYMWMGDYEAMACFERAKEGFVRLLGENSAKAADAAFKCCAGAKDDELVAKYARLRETANFLCQR